MKNLNSFMSGKSVGLFSMVVMWVAIPLAVNVAFSAPNNEDAWIARIRTDHPRMFFNAETWPAVKARAEGPARAARDNLLKRADAYPDDPVCSGFDPVTFREVKTASGTHKTTAATPIQAVEGGGAEGRGSVFVVLFIYF